MAQTPAIYRGSGCTAKKSFAADQKAGYVTVVNGTPMLAPHAVDISEQAVGDLQIDGLWDVPQAAEIIQGGVDVFWDADGDPVTGTSGSGAATATAAGNTRLGIAAPLQPNATANTAATDTYVRVMANAAKKEALASATVAAAGSSQSDAALLATGITWVTAANGTKGVKLPPAAAGLECRVKNDDTANALLKVYPNTSDSINALAANASLDMAAKTACSLACYDGTQWFSIPLLPS